MAEMMRDPAFEGATTLFQAAPGMCTPRTYQGVVAESAAYRTSAWIGIPLMGTSPVMDVVGPDAAAFLQSVCVNRFDNMTAEGMRHAVICDEQGRLLTDGVVIRVADDRFRTYWLNPPIEYLASVSGMDVRTEDVVEYFIQIEGEKSLEILEEAFQADLHDIRFARHRKQEVEGMQVEVIRLGMSGNLAYEIHGPMEDYVAIYDKVWAAGEKFGAKKLGLYTYNLFNHTEGGFPNINVHYAMPWLEGDEGLRDWCFANPMKSFYNLARDLKGSVESIEDMFVTPYDIGIGSLVNFDHEFTGKAALAEIAKNPPKTVVTLEWNPEDVAKVFQAQITPGGERVDDITKPLDTDVEAGYATGKMIYRGYKVLDADGNMVGFSSGRIISYNYNAMISLAFIKKELAVEGTELTLVWGTPGTPQFDIRMKVARFPYNQDMVRNEDRDVSDIPRRL